MLPTLRWSGDEVTITYQAQNRDMGDSERELIPIAIDSRGTYLAANIFWISDPQYSGNVNLGMSGGRKSGYSVQDPELAEIILNLLPEDKRSKPDILDIKMDKYVFFRVILTYLYNSSMEYLN